VVKKIRVNTNDSSYPILIQQHLLDHCPELLKIIGQKTPYIISNVTVAPLYLNALITLLGKHSAHFSIPDGEKYKSFQQFEAIVSDMLQHCLGRDCIIIALGGGVVGDLAGFVAACYQRGIPFVQIPTTLLAQVDASVGGKTAINHPLGKNMVGAFHQPSLVMIDLNCLNSLPQREYTAGLAEVIKYGLIMDSSFFQWITEHCDAILAKEMPIVEQMIARCCELKAQIVNADEKELGLRAILNLGHTFAHAIEAETQYTQYLHGEAVSIGLHAAMRLSKSIGLVSEAQISELQQLLLKMGLPLTIDSALSKASLLNQMRKDKKNVRGKLRFVLNVGIGKARLEVIEDDALIMAAIPYHCVL